MSTSQRIRIDKERVRFYLWVAAAFLLISMLSEISSSSDHFFARLVNNVWHLLFLVTINFIFLEYALKWFKFSVKGVLLSLLIVFVFMLTYAFGHYVWKQFGVALHIYTPLRSFASSDEELEQLMSHSMGTLFFFAVIRHIYDYRNLRLKTQQLQIEKQQAELNYLKSQTNPHFLFNTLNNIYSLARDKSDLAPESLLRLSKILRFMLYEASGAYISLERELKIISDFIALEKLRYDDSLRINYNHDIEDKQQAIPPLILIPLVENAFKHGASETRKDPFVDIHLSVKNRQLSFVVKNSVEDSTITQDVPENIGLSNLRGQLELLYSDYDLSLERKNFVFTAILKINLDSNVRY